MTAASPAARSGWTIESGPERIGNERVWRLRLPGGQRAVLAQLIPELAREPALRRRYVRDAEWLRDLRAPVVAEVLEVGPPPDPRDPAAEPPWRLRADPDGESLEAWLAARAPAPVDEAIDLAARLCDSLAEVHARGAVLRDLQPRQIAIGEKIWFTDVGLARSDILSSRTASSLILEGSPYASPEHLRSTRVDPRSDLYTVGVILWRALTGTLPFGDGPALLTSRGAVPRLSAVREAPAELDAILERCLGHRPEERFDSAAELADALRGRGAPGKSLVLVICQSCGQALRAGLRLCLHCGKAAIQFRCEPGSGLALDLVKLKEDAIYLAPLRQTLEAVSEPPPMPLNFLIGDKRMYAKEEREALIGLPARLWTNLSEESAAELQARLSSSGVVVKRYDARAARARGRVGKVGLAASGAAMVLLFATSHPLLALLCIPAIVVAIVLMISSVGAARPGLLSLRQAPAALPAADSLTPGCGARSRERSRRTWWSRSPSWRSWSSE